MIKFRCSNCDKGFNVPDNFAGKRSKCTKCKQSITVPSVEQKPSEEKTSIIKFRCPNCNQKTGVPKKYAGKRVRCNKCKEPMQVPGLKREVIADDLAGGSDIFGGGLGEELLSAEADAPAVEEPLRLKPTEPEEVPIGPETFGGQSRFEDKPSGGGIPEGAKIPLGLVAGLGLTIAGAVIWGLIAKGTGFHWGWIATIVAGLAGCGFAMFMHDGDRGGFTGFLAVVIGLIGIMTGKVFIAKWVEMPIVKERFTSGFKMSASDNSKKKHFSEGGDSQSNMLEHIVENKKSMFFVTCFHLADEGVFEEEFAKKVITFHLGKNRSSAENFDELRDAEGKVLTLIEGYSRSEREEIARQQEDRLIELMEKILDKTPVGFVIAFIGSFSLADFLWFPMGLWGAYKVGAGWD